MRCEDVRCEDVKIRRNKSEYKGLTTLCFSTERVLSKSVVSFKLDCRSHSTRPPRPISFKYAVCFSEHTLGMLFQWKFLRNTIKNYDEEHLSVPEGARL